MKGKPINIPIDTFSYSDQSDILEVPNEWIDDARCFTCGYSRESLPKLCICDEAPIGIRNSLNIEPEVPLRGTLTRRQKNKNGMKARASKWNLESSKGKFLSPPTPKTLCESFEHGMKLSNDGKCFGWRPGEGRPYRWLTYSQVLLRARNFGSGLIKMGLLPGPGTLVGIFAKNCVEWGIFEQALHRYSMVVIPIYGQLGPDALNYIVNETGMTIIVSEDDEILSRLINSVSSSIRCIVTIKDVKVSTLTKAAELGIKVVRFDEVENYGSNNLVPDVLPSPGSPAVVCFNKVSLYLDVYDGLPKGVMLSHLNIVSCCVACLQQMEPYSPNKDDVMISYLPMPHMLERSCQVGMMLGGGAIGFYSGNMRDLSNDIKALRPTVIPGVPNFLNRIYDKISDDVNSSNIKRLVYNMGLKRKTRELSQGIIRKDSMVDRLLFSSVKDSLGGRVRLMIVGSAPLAGNVLTFVRAALGCIILEGYGQTECGSCCTLTVQGDSSTDHVGPPISCSTIKLVDVPEMEYYSENGEGEICIRGPNVFLGYFKDAEKTKNVIDSSGWLHTGDVGRWLPNGTLKIIDRTKTIFKLSQGVYVSPEKCEQIFSKSPVIYQIFVHGEPIKSRTVAIVVPEVECLRAWASSQHIPSESFSSLCHNREVKCMIVDEIKALGKEYELKSFELPANIYLHPDVFSSYNGLINSVGKLKRKNLDNYFKPQLEDMYQKLD